MLKIDISQTYSLNAKIIIYIKFDENQLLIIYY
jgi:hypothetical protein